MPSSPRMAVLLAAAILRIDTREPTPFDLIKPQHPERRRRSGKSRKVGQIPGRFKKRNGGASC